VLYGWPAAGRRLGVAGANGYLSARCWLSCRARSIEHSVLEADDFRLAKWSIRRFERAWPIKNVGTAAMPHPDSTSVSFI
jgi:hypothetical protein